MIYLLSLIIGEKKNVLCYKAVRAHSKKKHKNKKHPFQGVTYLLWVWN